MIYNKPFKSNVDLLQIPKSKNLIAKDEISAINFLDKVHYCHLSAYFLTLQHPKSFTQKDESFDNTSFDDVVDLYEFNKKPRDIFWHELQNLEIALRTKNSTIHAKNFGAFGYLYDLNSLNTSHKLYHKFIKNHERDKEHSNKTFIKHIRNKYGKGGNLPIWATIKIMSFDTLSKLFSILNAIKQREILSSLNLPNFEPKIFTNWLLCLTTVCNIRTHHTKLFERTFRTRFKNPKKSPYFINLPTKKASFAATLSLTTKNETFKKRLLLLAVN